MSAGLGQGWRWGDFGCRSLVIGRCMKFLSLKIPPPIFLEAMNLSLSISLYVNINIYIYYNIFIAGFFKKGEPLMWNSPHFWDVWVTLSEWLVAKVRRGHHPEILGGCQSVVVFVTCLHALKSGDLDLESYRNPGINFLKTNRTHVRNVHTNPNL